MRCYRTYNDLIDSLNTTLEVKGIMKAVKREHFVLLKKIKIIIFTLKQNKQLDMFL